MKWYSIFFSENGRDNWMPIYEDYKHGRYWLGGTARLLSPLLFSSKKRAEEGIKRVILVELEQEKNPKGIFQRGKFAAKRCEIVEAAPDR